MSCPVLLQRFLKFPLCFWLFIIILSQLMIVATHGTEEVEEEEEDIEVAIREVFGPPPISKSTPTGYENCECVPIISCNDEIPDDPHIIQPRYQCSNGSEVCCYNVKNPIVSNNVPEMNCGHSNSVGFRITGLTSENEAQYGDFPWMVAILKLELFNTTYVCGGSLIHPKVVLTAIHCLHNIDPDELVIRVGDWDLKTNDELFNHQDGHVLKIIEHESYFSGTLINDIALIILTEPFILQENVGTICLPPLNYEFNGEKCYASGWGKNAIDIAVMNQDILKKIDLPIIPYDSCLNRLRRTRLGPKFKLHNSFICAGGEVNKDTCKGDGGSPLACPTPEDSGRFQQAGIVAWGIGCGTDVPGVYVNVARFRDWIDQQMTDHELDTSYYSYDRGASNGKDSRSGPSPWPVF